MEPLAGNSVINLQMLENGNGWAMLLWTVEGPGEVSLYHTSDYGNTWQFLTEIPKNIWFAYPTLMEFYSDNEGLIHMYDRGDLPQSTRIVFLSTSDGGSTWQETGYFDLSGESGESEQRFEVYFQEYEGRTFRSLRSVDRDVSMTMDGSQWKIEEGEGQVDVIYVLRRLSEDSEWEIVSILPKHYEYREGLIISP